MSDNMETESTPAQNAAARKFLAWMIAILLILGTGLVYSQLNSPHMSFMLLTFYLGILLATYLLWQARRRIGVATDPNTWKPPVPQRPKHGHLRLLMFMFGILIFSGFLVDVFLPKKQRDEIQAALLKFIPLAADVRRPRQPVAFELPIYMFNGQNMAMDVQVFGNGKMHGDVLELNIDRLRIADLLPEKEDYRRRAHQIVIDAIVDNGDHVLSVGRGPAIELPEPDLEQAFAVDDIQLQINLDAHADLNKIWLRLELWHDNSYTPLDATPGHLVKLLGQADPAFDPCAAVIAALVSPRKAIERQCDARLTRALQDPVWMLIERFSSWRGDDPLFVHAYRHNNLGAVNILQAAGLPVDALDTRQRTALMLAAWNNRADFVQALLAAGADPIYQAEPKTLSALSGALLDGYTATAKLMLQDLDMLEQQVEGLRYHPAHMIANEGHIDTLRMLLDAGLSVNTVNKGPDGRGETLLMAAARAKKNGVAMIDMLLERGAELRALDGYGKNATDWAEFFGNAAASDALCQRGLEPTPIDPDGHNNEKRKRSSCMEPSGTGAG